MNIIEDIGDALLHIVEETSPPPRTSTDLLTVLQDSWCEFPPGYLQTLVESMPHRFASLLHAHGAPYDIKKVYQFFWFFSVYLNTLGSRKFSKIVIFMMLFLMN
ncbi:hypothetical protein AVEN_114143-1 [Araneus ventricosus]|uniref:Uncharacterized protein n=1 Tax=Araneus ventricosus TaxID=182803 RepID=A0A4Y2Q0W4_ARAVE|nr:hypothetical protein AVEN_273593-1 [Araneus ventricosus]GBN57790.1 hypothetical protein AVEN_221166-1 [Araneus ventricosus]GBN57835.1 hypothetical protein AVEN_166122-1 [Araneus ventricosus]GBN57873.1 hypothetical protein AVEN_114143-1 [Araneus ventricosus]